jgi:hypothetical protein
VLNEDFQTMTLLAECNFNEEFRTMTLLAECNFFQLHKEGDKQGQDGSESHPDPALKQSSKTCMKLTSAECTVENS